MACVVRDALGQDIHVPSASDDQLGVVYDYGFSTFLHSQDALPSSTCKENWPKMIDVSTVVVIKAFAPRRFPVYIWHARFVAGSSTHIVKTPSAVFKTYVDSLIDNHLCYFLPEYDNKYRIDPVASGFRVH